MNQTAREEALFEEALQQPSAAERDAFLDGACQGNAPLRARLKALLDGHFAAGGFLQAESGTRPFPTASGGEVPLIGESTGTQIGRYTLLEKLGEGGFGVVYEAEQREPVKRRVAVKIIKPGMDTRQVVARFEAERQALAVMDHPHIARVLDGGATEQGRPYFVMELVRGIRITDYCDQNRLSTRQRIELFIQVCQAIQHAHQKGIIHRDIKPSNILVTPGDSPSAAVPKVIDFGIAKATQGELTDKWICTHLHQFIGTPAYMSPEQAEMSGLDVDTRSDIYSLGVLLYELLSGSTPFDGKELALMGLDAMRKTIRDQDPPPPSTKVASLQIEERTSTARRRALDAPKLLHQLRGDLDWIVMKCLEKDRTRRYETANGLAADLKRHLNHQPVVACPPSTAYRFLKAVRRHRVAFLGAAAVVVALLLGLTASLWQAVRATRAEVLATKRLAEAEAFSSLLTDLFQSSDPARSGRDVTVAETLDAAAQRLEDDLAAQPQRRAQLRTVLGQTYLALGLSGDAIPLLAQALDYYRQVGGRENHDGLPAMRQLGLAYNDARRHEEAFRLQEELLDLQRRIHGPESPEAIVAMMDLGNSCSVTKRPERARALHTDALRLSRRVNGAEHPDTVRALHSLSFSYSHAQALPLREEALALSRRVNGPNHPTTFKVAHNLELSYAAAGRDQDSLKLLEDLVPLSLKLNGPAHATTRRLLDKLERAYFAAGRWQDAVRVKADYARWDPKELNAELLAVQAWFGREAEYADTRARLLKWAEGTQIPTTAERAAKASLLLPLTDPAPIEQAWTLARRAVDLGADHQFLGWFQLALGMAEYRRGNYAAAEQALQAAQRMAPLNAGFFRAMCLHHRGQADEARQLFHETAQRMRRLPDDDQNPLAGGASGDDMIVWLAYREAKALLGIGDSGPSPLEIWLGELRQNAAANPGDTILSLHLASALLWSGMDDEHESLCRQLLMSAGDSSDPTVHDRAAKAYLLRSNPGSETLKLAAASARRALTLADPKDNNLPWYRTAAGAAAYREGNFEEAEKLLNEAIASPLHENQRRLALAFRAMAHWRLGQPDAARADLAELAKQNLILPQRRRMSPILRDQDQLAVRLAYAEVTALLNPGVSEPKL